MPSPTTRVRPDLWHGIVDYTSERPWVWDSKAGRARPAEGSEDLPKLPTITQDEMAVMRGSFVEQFDAPDCSAFVTTGGPSIRPTQSGLG